jgi:hypothetical protein
MKLNREGIDRITKEVEAGNAYIINKSLLRQSTLNRFNKSYAVETHEAGDGFIMVKKR